MLGKFHQRSIGGFSLIELLIVVALLGIISLFAIPGYQQQIRKANRAEAKIALTSGSQLLERCFTEFTSYSNAGCIDTTALDAMGNNFFTFAISRNSTVYTITATANSSKNQHKDTDCVEFSITSTGLKAAEDSAAADTSSKCW